MFADILGKPIKVSAVDEITARGAALCAAGASGIDREDMEEPAVNVPLKEIYIPDPDKYDWYRKHSGLYCELSDIMQSVKIIKDLKLSDRF